MKEYVLNKNVLDRVWFINMPNGLYAFNTLIEELENLGALEKVVGKDGESFIKLKEEGESVNTSLGVVSWKEIKDWLDQAQGYDHDEWKEISAIDDKVNNNKQPEQR